MVIPENERDRLIKESFIIPCPQCQTSIKTEYSKWEIQVLSEHEQSKEIDITCASCHASFSYSPAVSKRHFK